MRRFPFHPWLFAVAPILFLFAHNAGKLSLSPSELVLPFAAGFLLACIAWLVMFLAIGSGRKAAAAASFFLVLFFLYGHVATGFGLKSNPDLYLLPVWVTLFVLGAVFIARARSDLAGVTTFLNFVALVLVAANLGIAFPAILRSRHSSVSHGPSLRRESGTLSGTPPSIYYIILDGYGRQDVLEQVYRFDNSDFTEYLRNRGFFVASSSRSNYSQTYLSLASSLNMTYLDSVARCVGAESDNRSALLRMIADNRVMAELKRRGYTTVSFASGYTGTEFKNADVHYAPRWVLSEFQNVVISTTPLPLLLDRVLRRTQHDLHRERILYAFERLPDPACLRPPVFVFCHVLAPHPPFVFGPSGEKVRPRGLFTLTEGGNFQIIDKQRVRDDYIRDYRDQLAFITMKTRQTIDRILARSDRQPVIIIQADHGPGSILNWDDPEPEEVAERMAILNACLLPQDSAVSAWYDSISPVNTFRLVFNRLFGDTLALLEDRSWFSTIAKPYRFFDADRPESYAAGRGPDVQPLTIIAFRCSGESEAGDLAAYARRLASIKYHGETRPIARVHIRQVQANFEGVSVELAYRMYRDAVAAGEIPDLGEEYETYSGLGPDRRPVIALFFPARQPSKPAGDRP